MSASPLTLNWRPSILDLFFCRSLVATFLMEQCDVEVDASEGLCGPGVSEPLATIDGGQYAALLRAVVAGVKAFFAHCERCVSSR